MKDDEMVKSWIKEIKKDFDAGQKNDSKFSQNIAADGILVSQLDQKELISDEVNKLRDDVENDLEKLEKLGFTAEEMIEMLKKSTDKSNNAAEDADEESSGSESETESFKQSEETEKARESIVNGRIDTQNKSNVNKDSMFSNNEIQTKHRTLETETSTESENEMHELNTAKMEKEDWAVVVLRDPRIDEEEADDKTSLKSEWSALEIEDFVNIAEAEEEEEAWQPPVSLDRGKTGVFDVEELVRVVRAANAQDVVTVRIPDEINFADYMVIVTAKSQRHIAAIAADVKWIYKRKKSHMDRFVRVEGEGSTWYAMDLGNIILHIFMPAAREMYDLETLWTVGPKFDSKCIEQKDPYVFTVDELPWLKELEQASNDTDDNKEASADPDQSKTKVNHSSIKSH